MKTRIYKTYSDFLDRTERLENGVSEDFAKEYPDFEKQNETNEACWNCSRCSDCSRCSRCSDCSRCSGCSDCSRCFRCSDCDEKHNINLIGKIANKEQEIANLDAVREVILKAPQRLKMDGWHQNSEWLKHTPQEELHTCNTTHCLAGFLQVNSQYPEVRKMEPFNAGVICAPSAAWLFFNTKERVERFLRDREYAQPEALT